MDESAEQLVVDVADNGAVAQVTVGGELDVHTAPALTAAMTTAFERGASSIEVDASALRFCDSSGIQVLVQAREEALARGGGVTLTGVQGPVKKVLTVTGLLELFT
jgi:anti-sigma B factor antagonist